MRDRLPGRFGDGNGCESPREVVAIPRRAILAGGATGALALSAGCLGFVLGDEALEFGAARAAPSRSTLEETGHEEVDSGLRVHEETIDVGVTRKVRASYWVSLYSKRVTIADREHDASVFAAVSTPGMEVLGTSRNPFAEMEGRELLAEIRGEIESLYGELRDLQHDDSIVLPILGENREVDVFAGTADVEGEKLDVMLPLAAFEHGDDFLVLLGGYPRILPDEGVDVELLMESVEHPLE